MKHTHTKQQTHKPTHADVVVRQTCTHAQARAWGEKHPPDNKWTSNKREEGRNLEISLGEETIVWGHNCEKRKNEKPGECSSENKILPAAKGAGLRKRASWRFQAQNPTIHPFFTGSLYTSFLLPAVTLLTHLTCSTSLLLPTIVTSDLISTPLTTVFTNKHHD